MAKGAKTVAVKRPKAGSYRVFVSHAGDDIWVAKQISKNLEEVGAQTFLDRRDIAAGDNFHDRILEEIPQCDELLALFTPWSRTRAWVRHEIGMAAVLGKRIVCVFYKVTVADFRKDDDGLGPLSELNVIDINGMDTYLLALSKRARLK